MELIRPKLYTEAITNGCATRLQTPFKDKNGNLIKLVELLIISISEEIPSKPGFVTGLYFRPPMPNEKSIFDRAAALSESIKSSGNMAEQLCNKLRNVLARYKEIGNEKLKPSLNVNNYDFMGLATCLREIIKKDLKLGNRDSNLVDSIKGLETSIERKLFRRILMEFIEDRNIYIHGEVFTFVGKSTNPFKEPKIMIKHIIKTNDIKHTVASEIDETVLSSYLNCYQYLDKIIDNIKNAIERNYK